MASLMEKEMLLDACVEAMAELSRKELAPNVLYATEKLYDLHTMMLGTSEKDIDTSNTYKLIDQYRNHE